MYSNTRNVDNFYFYLFFVSATLIQCGRRSGPMVSALDTGSKNPGSRPGGGGGGVIVLCSWARHFTLTVPLSTQEYKWAPANCQGNLTKCWGVTCDGLASHPGGLAIILYSRLMLNRKPG